LGVGGWLLWQPQSERPELVQENPALQAVPEKTAVEASLRAEASKPVAESVEAPQDLSSTLLPPGEGLSRLWQLHAVTTLPTRLCPRSPYQGVSCIAEEAATWDEIARYRRPVVLSLVTAERFAAEVLLLEIAGTLAWVYTTDGERSVPLADLAPLWTGRFELLWRPPVGFGQPLTLGDEGVAVSDVAALFARLDGQPLPLATRTFNEALGQRVRMFQREHDLTPDGVVGVQTLLQLNEALGLDVTPSLARIRLREAATPLPATPQPATPPPAAPQPAAPQPATPALPLNEL